MNIKKLSVIALCALLIAIGCLINYEDISPNITPVVVVPHLIWFGGIILFCIILPSKVGTVFD